MRKRYFTPLLVILALAVWLGASLYLTGIASQYDDAVISNSYYFWFFAPIELIFCWLQEDERKPQKTSRWYSVFLFFLFTSGVYCLLLLEPDSLRFLPCQLYFWWFSILFAGLLAARLYENSPYRRPHKPKALRSPIQGAAVVVLLLYLSVAAVTALYLAVLRPVTVDEITPIGEAEGGEFISRITGDRGEYPLGLYWFRSDSLDYYYDVLTGEPVDYRRPGSLGYSPRYGD